MKTFILRDEAIVDRCCAFIRNLAGGEKLFAVTVTDANKARTLEQNDKLHAMFRDLSEQGWLNGRQGTSDEWKRWCLIRLGYADLYTDLSNGQQVAAPMSTSTMSAKTMSELIEQVHRLAADELGVEL